MVFMMIPSRTMQHIHGTWTTVTYRLSISCHPMPVLLICKGEAQVQGCFAGRRLSIQPLGGLAGSIGRSTLACPAWRSGLPF